jgi:hypothetical protein
LRAGPGLHSPAHEGAVPRTWTVRGREGVTAGYLDFFRESVAAKVTGLPGHEARARRLPSGWAPAELVKHLIFMERRWLDWGFLGEAVPEPGGDQRDGSWHVDADESIGELVRSLRQGGVRTRSIVEPADLTAPATLGGASPARPSRPL